MTRFAFLFGNTDGLKGVKKDIVDVESFLRSNTGGAWEQNEIVTAEDLPSSKVIEICNLIRRKHLDYVIVYFSGHGDMERSTNLCINPQEEIVSETAFSGLAQRQLMILDCCRVFPQVVTNTKRATFAESVESIQEQRTLCRRRYEDLIMAASPQEVNLYACQPGKCAYDSRRGGFYTQKLLSNAIEMSRDDDVYVKVVHEKASVDVFWNTALKDELQEPDIKTICDGEYEKDLVFAVKS